MMLYEGARKRGKANTERKTRGGNMRAPRHGCAVLQDNGTCQRQRATCRRHGRTGRIACDDDADNEPSSRARQLIQVIGKDENGNERQVDSRMFGDDASQSL